MISYKVEHQLTVPQLKYGACIKMLFYADDCVYMDALVGVNLL